jgi:hypothetical protein
MEAALAFPQFPPRAPSCWWFGEGPLIHVSGMTNHMSGSMTYVAGIKHATYGRDQVNSETACQQWITPC